MSGKRESPTNIPKRINLYILFFIEILYNRFTNNLDCSIIAASSYSIKHKSTNVSRALIPPLFAAPVFRSVSLNPSRKRNNWYELVGVSFSVFPSTPTFSVCWSSHGSFRVFLGRLDRSERVSGGPLDYRGMPIDGGSSSQSTATLK